MEIEAGSWLLGAFVGILIACTYRPRLIFLLIGSRVTRFDPENPNVSNFSPNNYMEE